MIEILQQKPSPNSLGGYPVSKRAMEYSTLTYLLPTLKAPSHKEIDLSQGDIFSLLGSTLIIIYEHEDCLKVILEMIPEDYHEHSRTSRERYDLYVTGCERGTVKFGNVSVEHPTLRINVSGAIRGFSSF